MKMEMINKLYEILCIFKMEKNLQCNHLRNEDYYFNMTSKESTLLEIMCLQYLLLEKCCISKIKMNYHLLLYFFARGCCDKMSLRMTSIILFIACQIIMGLKFHLVSDLKSL